MKLLQERVFYKWLNIEKNCKEEIICFISLLCLFQCLHVQQKIETSYNMFYFCLNNCLSLNLQSVVNTIKTVVFWKLVSIFCYIDAKKISARKAEEFLQNKHCTKVKLTSFGSRVPFESLMYMKCENFDRNGTSFSSQNKTTYFWGRSKLDRAKDK